MIDPMTAILIAKISCEQPRMGFRSFFLETQHYSLDRPPNAMMQHQLTINAADALAGFADYVTAYNEKCGVKK